MPLETLITGSGVAGVWFGCHWCCGKPPESKRGVVLWGCAGLLVPLLGGLMAPAVLQATPIFWTYWFSGPIGQGMAPLRSFSDLHKSLETQL